MGAAASESIEISVVVPLRNEAQVIEQLFQRLGGVLQQSSGSWEVVFVDDGSTDGTLSVLRDLQARSAGVRVVELSRNYGQTAALAAGIDYARGSVIITMDGDLQHEPEEIPRFLEKLAEGYDIVSGCRAARCDNMFSRRFPSYCANALMRRLSQVPVQDFGSTYKAYRADMIKHLELFGELHRFIPILAARRGARIAEIPIHVKPRSHGASHYGLGRVFGVFQDIIFLEFYLKYLTKPMRAFGRLFLGFFGAGFLISVMLMLLWALGRVANVFEHGALLIFSVFLMSLGVQFLVTGVLAELVTRIYMHTSQSHIYTVRNVYE